MLSTRPTLNQGQQAAADGFFDFLFSNDKELIISGPGGVGKSFLMGYLIDEIMPRYEKMCSLLNQPAKYLDVHMTATTNKAAEVLAQATGRPCGTVHSFLGLKVTDDFTTGVSKLSKTNNWKVHQRIILFVDEASMVDATLLKYIREAMLDCKVVFVGDHCQLAPVKEAKPPVFNQGLPMYVLTEPMRNNGQPALMSVCQQLRDTVEQGTFKPIRIVPGVIDLLNDEQMLDELNRNFIDADFDGRILAYSNARVLQYGDFIRKDVRRLPDEFVKGEHLVNNTMFQRGKTAFSVEEEVTVMEVNSATDFYEIEPGVHLEYRLCHLCSGFTVMPDVMVPVDRGHYTNLIKWYAKQKDWQKYYFLKNNFPDLRQRDACTVHKSQGSTYNTTYIDLENLSTCTQSETGARLLYVAFTRARNRVVLYGDLTKRFGGLIS